MPKVFASMISDDDMPNGANLVNAIVASLGAVPAAGSHRRHFQRCLLDALRYLRCLPAADLHPDVPGHSSTFRKNDPNRERILRSRLRVP